MKKVLLIVVVVIVVGVAYYAISPLFDTQALDEDIPTVAAGNENEQRAAEPEVRGPFPVMDTPLHPASGSVFVYENADGTSTVRFENFETINGPNIHIYLANDLEANDYIDIGPLKGTSGNINYEVPAGIDVADYRYVLHWCEPFSVLFNYAEI